MKAYCKGCGKEIEMTTVSPSWCSGCIGFSYGNQVPAYGNEKSAAQVIQELKEERDSYKSQNARLRRIAEKISKESVNLKHMVDNPDISDTAVDFVYDLIISSREALQQEGDGNELLP